MKQESKRKAQREILARGVAKLSNTPEYVMRSALQSITGFQPSVFTNMTNEDLEGLYFYALG
eukprot:6991285-Lingulodinium_polyedra.AAC.1